MCDLLNDTGDTWDRDKLEVMFTLDDIEDILQICMGGQGSEDFMAWNFTKSGQFSIMPTIYAWKRNGQEQDSRALHRQWRLVGVGLRCGEPMPW